VRASFSFANVQLALWFGFAVATALFLWVLYGDLPKIDSSVLTLLGLSLGTSGVSWMADRSAAASRPYQPTQGFWLDMTTGWADDKMQVYRYQAVVVNLLLLAVGVVHVVQQLTYPTFDSTWLIFLGVSAGAFGVGKQVKET
jgi:xanthine/uracil permease